MTKWMVNSDACQKANETMLKTIERQLEHLQKALIESVPKEDMVEIIIDIGEVSNPQCEYLMQNGDGMVI